MEFAPKEGGPPPRSRRVLDFVTPRQALALRQRILDDTVTWFAQFDLAYGPFEALATTDQNSDYYMCQLAPESGAVQQVYHVDESTGASELYYADADQAYRCRNVPQCEIDCNTFQAGALPCTKRRSVFETDDDVATYCEARILKPQGRYQADARRFYPAFAERQVQRGATVVPEWKRSKTAADTKRNVQFSDSDAGSKHL
jgi:hypothetical protein